MEHTVLEFQKPVLLVAAETLAATRGQRETVADVIRARALRHYSEGLRQYLAIRLGSRESASDAMNMVESRLEGWDADGLTAAPGARAQLYRLAREVATEQRSHASTSRPHSCSGLRFQPPANDAPAGYAQALEQVRNELPRDQAELLELRYARELSPTELAHVMGLEATDVITLLSEAADRARALLGQDPPSRLGGLRGALQEAFALAPTPTKGKRRSKGRPEALPKGTVIGQRYEIETRVGEGSFGDVYRAMDRDVPGHVVALKLLHQPAVTEQARSSALRELRLIASVFHPSVVDFKDHGWHEQRLWFVMPWYEGETLEERIRRTPLTRGEAADIFRPLAQALSTMHASGIRHQDIKPDNIFLARIGEKGAERILPVLIDLGVAAKEAEMIVAGTPLYFAPEIASQYASKPARRAVSSKSDVFSLALSLRNALEPSTQEQVPGTAVEAFIAHRADHPPKPPKGKDLRFLDQTFERWLARDPEDRPSAEELATELQELTRPELRKARRRNFLRWAAPLSTAAAVVLASFTYVYIQQRQETERAKIEADDAQAELTVESARRQQLQAGVDALQEDYQDSLSTTEELKAAVTKQRRRARRLGSDLKSARKEVGQLENAVGSANDRVRELTTRLQGARRENLGKSEQISQLSGQLNSSQQHNRRLDQELGSVQARLDRAERSLHDARARSRGLLTDLDEARAQALKEGGRASELERALLSTQQERSQAQRELAEERRKNARLERQARDQAQTPAPGPQPGAATPSM